jgi:hypothetical protein
VLAARGRVGGLGRAARRGGRRFVATVDEIAPGRVFFGVGSNDSAIVNLAERPSTLADLRAYIETVRALQTKGETTWRGAIDLWTMVRANVTDDVAAGIDEIKMELASNAHHVFRFTLECRKRHASYSWVTLISTSRHHRR